MRLGRRERKDQEVQIELTPMLDIVFIMLIFFIVTTTFTKESAIEVNKPQTSQAAAVQQEVLTISVDKNNLVYFNNQIIDVESIPRLLQTSNRDVSLLINADRLAYNGTVVSIMDKAKSAGVTQISLGTELKR
ncbi:ExbD/TolR family protein [Vibrio sonorensis]|uniref:ExbD/TolR family protein n=1 Tax=Vibrio sonorensis TaxID=1004316 RepID=UPI0008DA36DA|nr:biopolymer transporter ExbD [Vibrio sonorensis]